MTKTLTCRPRVAKEDLGSELGLRVGSLVTIKEPWLVYSAKVGNRRLELFRPALDNHSPRPGELAIITKIEEGGRHGDQFHIKSLDGKREDWFDVGDFKTLEDCQTACQGLAK